MSKPKLVQEIINLNRRCSVLFDSSNAKSDRAFYRAKERYFKMWTACMDSRVDIPCATKAPIGVNKHFRNLAGKFSFEWEKFDEVFHDCHEYHLKEDGKGSIALFNYHLSKGDPLRGCKGFNFDEEAAINAMFVLQEQCKRVYGDNTESMIPIVCGLETDEGSLRYHGDKGQILDLADINIEEFADDIELKRYLQSEFRKIFPRKPRGVIDDLGFMGLKNLEHINEIRKSGRPIADLAHKERAVILGRGADSIYEPNLALIIGMYSDEPEEAVMEALGIIRDNFEEGRIKKEEGFVFMFTSSYGKENGMTYARSVERATGYKKLGLRIVKKFPELLDYMHVLTAVTNLDNRLLTVVNN